MYKLKKKHFLLQTKSKKKFILQELQEKIDRDSAQIESLENQKNEMQVKLNEVEVNKKKLDELIHDMNTKIQQENLNVNKF